MKKDVFTYGQCTIQLLLGNIVDLSCDAIVNTANVYLQNGSGVCGAIFHGAGSALKAECEKHIRNLGRNLLPSEAVVTQGFDLPAKHIIHSVSPRCMFQWNEKFDNLMHQTYATIFQIVDQQCFTSVALPALGIGHHHCSADNCTSIAMEELFIYLQQPTQVLQEIRFVLFEESIYDLYQTKLLSYLKQHQSREEYYESL